MTPPADLKSHLRQEYILEYLFQEEIILESHIRFAGNNQVMQEGIETSKRNCSSSQPDWSPEGCVAKISEVYAVYARSVYLPVRAKQGRLKERERARALKKIRAVKQGPLASCRSPLSVRIDVAIKRG